MSTLPLAARLAQLTREGHKVGVLILGDTPPETGIALPADPAAYSRGLYAALRELDRRGYARLLIEAPPETEAWRAVNDRLLRAVS